MDKKISTEIIQFKNLLVRLHLKLVNESEGREDNFHQVFTINDNTYIKLDLQSFITMELTHDKKKWDKSKNIIVDKKNICHILKGFESMVKAIYEEGIFAFNEDHELIAYADMVQKYTIKIFNIGTTQKMVLKPVVMYDENDVSYEAVMLIFNKVDNFVCLSIDEFESLIYNLKQVNFVVYTQALLTYYLTAVKGGKVEVKEKEVKQPKKVHPFLVEEDSVKTNIFKEKTDKEFFNWEDGKNENSKL